MSAGPGGPKPRDTSGYKPELAVLKGIVEKRDAGAYFASFLALDRWREQAAKRGWIALAVPQTEGNPRDVVTEAGQAEYKARKLDKLPQTGRAYLWRWPAEE